VDCNRQPFTEARIKDHRIQLAGTTTLASNLKGIGRSVDDPPVVDPVRVAAVRDALARGEYEINRERIAEKLVQLVAAARSRGRNR